MADLVHWLVKYAGIALVLWVAGSVLEQAMDGLRAQGRAEICDQIGWRHPACSTGRR
jgi:hypothetical protein